MNGITDWRDALAARLADATGLEAFAYPPPTIVPPCVILLPGFNGVDYITGRRTHCQIGTQVTARLVTAVHESSGAFADVDELIWAALGVVPSFVTVAVRSETYGGARYWVADIVVTESVALDEPIPAALRRT